MSKIVESFLTALGSDLSDARRAIRRYGIGSRSSAPRHVAAAFSPLSLNPSLWLKADRGLYQESTFTTPAVADADPVGGWQDQSGNARHMIQTTAGNRPALKLAIKNGKPVVRFDGVNDWMLSNAAASAWKHLHDGTGSTVFIVLNQTADADVSVLITGAWSSTNRGYLLYRDPASDRPALYIDNGTSNILSLNGSANSWIHNQWKILESSYEDHPSVTDAFIHVNGSSVGSADDTGSPSTSDPHTTLHLATRNTVLGTALLTGDVAEIVIYPSVLTTAQRTQVRDYLNSEYAVY